MPISFPAHQVVVLPLKRRWPHRFDGLALVIGSGAPDLHRAVDPLYEPLGTHSPLGITIFSVPFTVLYSYALRRRGLPGLLRLLPVTSLFRRYQTMASSGPGLAITVLSAYVGAISHIVIDGFTHPDNPLARAVGFNTVIATFAGRAVTPADLLQYAGHSLGSVAGIYLLWLIAKERPPVPLRDEPTTLLSSILIAYVLAIIAAATWWTIVSPAFPMSSLIFFSAVGLLGASMAVESTVKSYVDPHAPWS